MKSQRIYLTLIVVFLLIIGFSIYYLLGGFEERKVYTQEGIEKYLIGETFIGTPGQEEEIFQMMRGLLRDSVVKGDLTVISYQNDTIADNQVHLFVGIALSSAMAEIPVGYEKKQLATTARLRVFLTRHPLVRPPSSSIEEMISEAAAEKGWELRPFFLETYFPDNSVIVEGWRNP
jgi:hypothetical protein